MRFFLTRWFLKLLGILSIAAIVTCSASGATYWLLFILPSQTYESLEKGAWGNLNVEHARLSNQAAFYAIENKLLTTIHQQSEQESRDPIPHFLLGRYYAVTEHQKKALMNYRQAEERILTSPPWRKLQFSTLLDNLYCEEALILYRESQKQAALTQLLKIQNQDALDDPALAQALQDTLSTPERADSHYHLGIVFRHLALLKEARYELRSALRLAEDPILTDSIQQYIKYKLPKNLSALSPWGRYEFLSGVSLLQAADENAGDGNKRTPDLNAINKAIRCFQHTVQDTGGFEWAYQKLSEAYYASKQYQVAAAWAAKAMAVNPDYYSAYLTLADIEMDQTHYASALDSYNKAVILCEALHRDQAGSTADNGEDAENLAGTIANIHNQMGFALEAMGQKSNALAQYRMAYDLADEETDDFQYAEAGIERIRHSQVFPK